MRKRIQTICAYSTPRSKGGPGLGLEALLIYRGGVVSGLLLSAYLSYLPLLSFLFFYFTFFYSLLTKQLV